MRYVKQHLVSFVLITALALPVAVAGCAARVETGYRVYDPYGHDYRAWDHDDVIYYQSWETDTHRHHEDFSKRDKREQQEYWDWRHNHDHDHDHH
jgi:hypothetical protein